MATKRAKAAKPKPKVKLKAKVTVKAKAKPKTRTKPKVQPVKAAPQKIKVKAVDPLDLAAFPQEAVSRTEKSICLACVLDVFTRLLGMAARTAHLEVKKYTPSLEELAAGSATRPFFLAESAKDPCPYCSSAAKWHASLRVARIESGKATDSLRRDLVKSLPAADDQFVVVEEKARQQDAFFEWLDKLGAVLDLDDPRWLHDLSLHYLSRKEPKINWHEHFAQTHTIRRSRRLETGWEIDNGRLFLAPMLFDELLLMQYLVSRSHKAGGLTLEGRYTLQELFSRLRNSGYLRSIDIHTQNPNDALEQLVNHLSGGENSVKFYYIVDRRDFLERLKALRLVKPPRPKKVGAS